MLYYLLYVKLFHRFSPFRVFGYITFRTAYASLTALMICLLLGPWLIRKLREFQIGQIVREEGPQSHRAKQGTPTMGGLLINISILIPTLLWADLTNVYVWIAIYALTAFGLVGFIDDSRKLRKKQNLGLTVKSKLTMQVLISLALGIMLLLLHKHGLYSSRINVPFLKFYSPNLLIDSLLRNPYTYPLGFIFFFLFVILVLVGCSNAVNLTDGLDGLAIGLTVIAAGALTILTYASGHAVIATYLEIQRVSKAGELTIFCGSMVGASLGFLWYNAHPAEIFMGDVGSLALGGALGAVAVLVKQEILLVFIGGVFVIEALSVILQVASFKLRGKRVFKMAPLHHHFEALGWQESKIIARFWITGLVLALFALTTLKLR
ncbi:MAG TPA: phospho-N-acetylmuramoyl-pentapeptide-transferase [Bryobacterales bacterium]|nr:phospho-N-acetylmuramoyl-pentapeptide-transferase [Bryobacterales bacterium]